MSFSNRKIIKNTKIGDEAIHIDEHLSLMQEEFIEKTSQKQLEEIKKEIEVFKISEMAKANSEVEDIRESAYNDGLAKAKEEALVEARAEMEMVVRKEWEDAFEKVEEQYSKANKYLIEIQESIENKKQKWLEKNENDIVEILISSVKKILAKEIHLENEDLKGLIKESFNEVNDKSKTIWIRVNPEVKKKIDSQSWNEREIEWISDPKLSELDVLIETENEWIDSTLKNKIENLKNIIEEWVKQNDLLNES